MGWSPFGRRRRMGEPAYGTYGHAGGPAYRRTGGRAGRSGVGGCGKDYPVVADDGVGGAVGRVWSARRSCDWSIRGAAVGEGDGVEAGERGRVRGSSAGRYAGTGVWGGCV